MEIKESSEFHMVEITKEVKWLQCLFSNQMKGQVFFVFSPIFWTNVHFLVYFLGSEKEAEIFR